MVIHYEEVLYQVYAPLPFLISLKLRSGSQEAVRYLKRFVRVPVYQEPQLELGSRAQVADYDFQDFF